MYEECKIHYKVLSSMHLCIITQYQHHESQAVNCLYVFLFLFICLYYHHLIVFFIFQVATGIANLSDLRAIHGALVIYKKILSHLYDTHFDVNLQSIDHLLMADFSLLDGLYNELNTAVGQIISEHSVMEGYSNTADEIKERLNNNTRQVEELRDLYR